ncbi:hypothetical protein CRENBAI_019464 [Crenichthys baileyi]|uniref:Uncharacterized protein n=1 Tax=Crenichthys baileyi TaxID=28760 RepID=A0AAV9RXM5_9TELE
MWVKSAIKTMTARRVEDLCLLNQLPDHCCLQASYKMKLSESLKQEVWRLIRQPVVVQAVSSGSYDLISTYFSVFRKVLPGTSKLKHDITIMFAEYRQPV